jgi:diaminohydroxyphosphoribosylaminopyrimidine deaminase/5-amino-6-(5-phosphoribosylamino)uracil reductase
MHWQVFSSESGFMRENEFMEKAVELAEKGRLYVSPNPMVGCVIVKNGKIVGKGYHKFFGGKHAEIVALGNAGKDAKGATMYVTLEPCCHFGKQPPCTDGIIKSGIRKVVVAVKDPNPVVNGCGIREMRKAGIKVEVLGNGAVKEKILKQNSKYFKFRETGIPFILLKVAMTADGKLTWGNGKRKKISGKETTRLAHQLRSEYEAVLVGINTVLKDDPRLTCRIDGGRQPIKVIVDSEARIPLKSRVLNGWRIIVVCTKKAPEARIRKIQDKGAGVLVVKQSKGKVDLGNLMKQLGMAGISSVLVEGGAKIIGSFINEGIADGFVFVVSRKSIGKGVDAIDRKHISRLLASEIYCMGNDIVVKGIIYKKSHRRKS